MFYLLPRNRECHLVLRSENLSHWQSKIYPPRLRVTVTQGRRSDVLSFSESIETEIDIWL